ncbi:MAG: Dyp-type peroxidase [Sporocytophaga sp.]|uniref:Dyp-type peroxidase n=1 Tax=Sporocytophaga sp. TaxID=2231183 RepID=UPI001B02F08F|nr:Dyp-type peroxidase [Sporocytophaga sp.]MBO9699026.1 Dyp-type peroxidase [Sporocytophaga sp.]
MTGNIEFKDIQGLIVRGYSDLPASCFLLLNISDAVKAKQWLRVISEEITAGTSKPIHRAMHIAFTYSGIKKLGMDENSLKSFAREFKEGMTSDHRKRALGDLGGSDTTKWQWGGPANEEVHILLMLYYSLEKSLEEDCAIQVSKLDGLNLIKRLDSNLSTLQKRKEHFGFHDGISQPLIKGFNKQADEKFMVEPGEFILGYQNEYLKLPDSPWVSGNENPYSLLPLLQDGSNNYDFGKNGSYMVFRQISQDVLRFWKFMEDATCEGGSDEEKRVRLASKMMGRWPSGAPLVKCPDRDNPDLGGDNSFEFYHADRDGLKCPFGSHVRRSNPRNSKGPTPEESDLINKRHKILRRGRPYGTYIESSDPAEIAAHPELAKDRGLHFICFNTSISRQFEFIQDTWLNSSKFQGLYNDPDPISGNALGRCRSETGTFTIQAEPVRERIKDVPAFTKVIGGAYFFMPGIKAVKYLSSIN